LAGVFCFHCSQRLFYYLGQRGEEEEEQEAEVEINFALFSTLCSLSLFKFVHVCRRSGQCWASPKDASCFLACSSFNAQNVTAVRLFPMERKGEIISQTIDWSLRRRLVCCSCLAPTCLAGVPSKHICSAHLAAQIGQLSSKSPPRVSLWHKTLALAPFYFSPVPSVHALTHSGIVAGEKIRQLDMQMWGNFYTGNQWPRNMGDQWPPHQLPLLL